MNESKGMESEAVSLASGRDSGSRYEMLYPFTILVQTKQQTVDGESVFESGSAFRRGFVHGDLTHAINCRKQRRPETPGGSVWYQAAADSKGL